MLDTEEAGNEAESCHTRPRRAASGNAGKRRKGISFYLAILITFFTFDTLGAPDQNRNRKGPPMYIAKNTAANPRPGSQGAPRGIVTITETQTLLGGGSGIPPVDTMVGRAVGSPRDFSRKTVGGGMPDGGGSRPGSGLGLSAGNQRKDSTTTTQSRTGSNSELGTTGVQGGGVGGEGDGTTTRGTKRKWAQGGHVTHRLRPRTERIQKRLERRRAATQRKARKEKKRKRQMGCRRAREKEKEAGRDLRRRDVRGGTWNTRGLGAKFGRIDPFLRAQCFFTLFRKRKWDFALLSDLRYSGNGVREYGTKEEKWTLVVQGKVGIAMSARLTRLWREGGAKTEVVGRTDVSTTRAVAVSIPAKGWKKGMMLMATYAPTSGTTLELVEERKRFWEDVGTLSNRAQHGTKLIIGGDMNAEVGPRKGGDDGWIIGPFGEGKRSTTGEAMMEFCQEQAFTVVNTYFQQSVRATWWHVRYATPHELDHFITRQNDRRDVKFCKSLHFYGQKRDEEQNKEERKRLKKERAKAKKLGVYSAGTDVTREDGVIAWSPYTDHEPVEICICFKIHWDKNGDDRKVLPVPDFARLVGPSEEARNIRDALAEQLDAGMEGKEGASWEELCHLSNTKSLEVLGEKAIPHPRPWMRGRERDKDSLDEAVHEAQQRDREATRTGTNEAKIEARRALRKAQKDRKMTIRKWENGYWKDLGERASEAGRRGDQGEMYRILKELKVRGMVRMSDGSKGTVGDVEGEREAWKMHFEAVSVGRPEVDSKVWRNIPITSGKAKWLGSEPTAMELDRCVANTKVKRAPGADGFTAELLKFGGAKLKRRVYEVVQAMWNKATEAEDGEEAHEWPEVERPE